MKKKFFQKTVAVVMAASLTMSACPISAYADEREETLTETATEVEDTTECAQAEAEEAESPEETVPNTEDAELNTEETTVQASEETTEQLVQKDTVDEETTEFVETEEESTEALVKEEKQAVTVAVPEIGNDGKVTFHYYPEEGEVVQEAYVKGSWSSDWSKYYHMSADENGVWSVTADLSLDSSYEYGIMVNDEWKGDPTNPSSDGNSQILRNPSANTDGSYSIYYYPQNNENVTLAYKEAADEAYTTVEMKKDAKHAGLLSASIADAGEYEYYLVVNGKKQEDKNAKSQSFAINKLPEDDQSVKSPVVEGNQVTFNYFGPTAKEVKVAGDMTSPVWGDGAKLLTYNEKTGFWSITMELKDGTYQYKFIVDGKWITDPRSTAFEGDNSGLYVNVDKPVETEKRYILVEYDRTAGDYADWNIYSWNSGFGSETKIFFEKRGDKMVAEVPVTQTKDGISFCMRRSEEGGNAWAEKDGGDHAADIPLDQSVVKVIFRQNEGIVGHVVYNVGYENDTVADQASFYYRDDELFRTYEEASLEGKVKLIFDGTEYDMTYDAENERYAYQMPLPTGEHYYAYKVDGTLVLDKFNEDTKEVDGITYSKYNYIKLDATLSATVTPAKIDYNDNAVLKVSFGEDVNEDVQIVSITADLSELGLSKKYAIDPELMEGTIAVVEGTKAGEKNIPITIKDKFANVYTTTAKVTVKDRNKGNDFDWDEAVIYFTVTDRFFDGNSSNNNAYGTDNYDVTQGSLSHGGDFAGLEQKLDYLQKLGVNTIWITPIVDQTAERRSCGDENQEYEGQYNTCYHGYWASDFTKLNKQLGTEEEFSSLIDAVHKRGMKLMVDVVLNHAGYGSEDYFNSLIPGKKMLRDETTWVSGDDKKYPLSLLPDFITEDNDVRSLLVEWQSSWISKYDIDYYRVDTVKHVDDTTWKAFKNALTKINPEFKMIGEYAGAGYATSAGQLGTGQMDALLDFDFNDKALDFVNGNLSNIEEFMEKRNAGIDNTATMGSFLSSHDEDGLMYKLKGSYSDETAYDLMKVAATLQITAKGQPVIYYGEELGQTGANNWPYQTNRYDMDWEHANADNDMYVHYAKLLAIRNQYTDVFAKGGRQTVALQKNANTNKEEQLVIQKTYGNDTLYIGFNIVDDSSSEITLNLEANSKYTDLYSNTVYTTDENGKVVVTIPAAKNGGTVVLVKGEVKAPTTDVSSNKDDKATVTKNTSNKKKKHHSSSSSSSSTVTTTTTATNTTTIEEDTVALADRPFQKVTLFTNAAVKTYVASAPLTEVDMGQGFKGMVFIPKKENTITEQLVLGINLGAEYAGKPVYVFGKNALDGQMVLQGAYMTDMAGSIQIDQAQIKDYIILY